LSLQKSSPTIAAHSSSSGVWQTGFRAGTFHHAASLDGPAPATCAAATEALNDSKMRAHTMIVVAGVEFGRGRDGFVLLASHDEPSGSGDQAAAEDFLDASCSL
jgi:hypothetical protein